MAKLEPLSRLQNQNNERFDNIPRYMHDGFHVFSKLASGSTWCVAASCIKDAEKESHDKQTTCQKSNFLGSLEIKIWNSYLDFACKYAPIHYVDPRAV